jgi:NADH pyrophosphatase NudC (nudix superfamily)
MEWLLVLAAVAVLGIAALVWRDRRRGPVCPHCGEPDTFGPEGTADVCANCGFDFRADDY